jgi:transposase
MLSSIRLSGNTESIVLDSAVDKKIFVGYMEEVLLRELNDNDIVIPDNLSAHKNSFDINKFTSRNIKIKYLPPYSPDVNPLEKMWSKIKTKLRETQTTNTDALFQAIKHAFESIISFPIFNAINTDICKGF